MISECWWCWRFWRCWRCWRCFAAADDDDGDDGDDDDHDDHDHDNVDDTDANGIMNRNIALTKMIMTIRQYNKRVYGGFLSHRGTPSHHPFLFRIFHGFPIFVARNGRSRARGAAGLWCAVPTDAPGRIIAQWLWPFMGYEWPMIPYENGMKFGVYHIPQISDKPKSWSFFFHPKYGLKQDVDNDRRTIMDLTLVS